MTVFLCTPASSYTASVLAQQGPEQRTPLVVGKLPEGDTDLAGVGRCLGSHVSILSFSSLGSQAQKCEKWEHS